ncbi:MAG: DUF1318 domain-containing protein [Candidatus Aureabacteria bacterium]|nr:DUF1318 domain-containing protein [Candidatus Auribacterota bacterium]
MKKSFLAAVFFLCIMVISFSSCKTEHKIAVETNEPIKIEARIDIYLHATSIEDMVSGKAPIPEAETSQDKRGSSLYMIWKDFFGAKEAWAQDIPFKSYTKEIQDALERRKNRYQDIQNFINQGKAEEGSNGYLKPGENLSSDEKKIIKDENADRKFIYEELAKQNSMPLEKVEKAFGKVHSKKS